MKKTVACLIVLSLLLGGCSQWMSSSYFSVESHVEPSQLENQSALPVSSYSQLCQALISLVREGANRGVLYVQYADEVEIREDMDMAIGEICRDNPFAVYTVEEMSYECGAGSGGSTVSVKINYLQGRIRANQIQRIQNTEQAMRLIAQQLEECQSGLVLYVDSQEQVDYAQMVMDYALANPHTVMEIPQVTVSRYPEQGTQRVIEIQFGYQTNLDELRALRNKVTPVFASAQQHASGNWAAREKLNRLYSFLMERYDEYHIQASVTPAYSLLLHGVGDCRAFAMVYGAMCRQIGIDCKVVIGTRDGEAWAWNVIQLEGTEYYIDLLRCAQERKFTLRTGEQMQEYVANYST